MSSVAVKNPETSSPGVLDRLHVGVVAGVVYILGSLAILLELLPWLWWGPLGFQRVTASGVNAGALAGLVLVGVAVAAGLVYGGARLLGPHPTPGVKAGIFTGLVALLLIALLTRWASYLFEGLVYDGKIGETLGIILTVAVAVVLLVLAGRFLFLAPSFAAKMVAFEEQGWFSATSYKRSQGRLVRRGTIVAVLALAGCGIYALEKHETLAGAGDWGIGIPFTGVDQVKTLNDARPLYTDKRKPREVALSLSERPGESPAGIYKESRPELDLKGEVVGLIATTVVADSAAAKAGIRDGDTITQVDGEPVSDVDSLRSLLEAARSKEKDTARLTVLPGSGFPVDQATFRARNAQLDKDYLRITDKGASSFTDGQLVTKDDWEKERVRIESRKEPGEKVPAYKKPDPATATVAYATVPLLPQVRYTLPVLLAALSLWLAWRIVNVPAFADFLVATEAELNKVSWTTRRRLVQDTIVVLVTVLLFTVFLFVVDVAWGKLLSWKAVGVLKLPEGGKGDKPPEQNW
jgi:preprotein translocase SecE subunit